MSNNLSNDQSNEESIQETEEKDEIIKTPRSIILEKIKNIIRYDLFCSYIRTRNAIKHGDNLYDYKPEEIKSKKLMGPWEFNIAESTLASFIALAVVKISNFVYLDKYYSNKIINDSEKMLNTVQGWFWPFWLPFSLMILAPIIARGGLKKKDLNQKNIKRTCFAYLYFDGAYGLYPQLFVTLCYSWGNNLLNKTDNIIMNSTGLLEYIAPTSVLYEFNSTINIITIIIYLMGYWGLLSLSYFENSIMCKLMFKLNGYKTKIPKFKLIISSEKNPELPPIERYRYAVFISGMVLGITIILWNGATMGIAWLLYRLFR